ncbi:MAG: alpha-glucosidase [Spirochaetaceae bacterium]|nr:MAG: alpha-glucosidase [Spirochaetaceae bacterium]
MIQLEVHGEGFSLSYKGRKLIEHNRRRPCLAVGRGDGRYRSVRAHFRIRDRVQERAPCREFRVLNEAAGANEIAQESAERELAGKGLPGRMAVPQVAIEFPGRIRLLCSEEQGRLCMRFADPQSPWNRVWLDLWAEPREHIYGCGEQYSELDLRGKRLPVWSQEQGIGRGRGLITLLAEAKMGAGGHWYSSYFPLTAFLSSYNWSCLCDSPAYAEFDFRDKNRHRLEFWQIPESIRFDVQDSAPAIVGAFSDALGRQPPVPEWTLEGMWLGVQGGPEVILEKIERALDAGIHVSAVWVQDWVGRRLTSFGSQLMWNWRYDAERYPELPTLIEKLHSRGIRFLGYINPFLAIEKELYQEASARGFCVKNGSGRDHYVTITDFPAAMIDLTNPDARDWIKGVIRENLIGIGLDGWMADYGEYLPPGAVLASGESWDAVHNRYPAWWARVNWEALQETGREKEVVFFMRAGYHGSVACSPAFWAGDQLVNWNLGDGLATVIPAGISLGLQGIGHFHSDVGGFTTVAWIRRSKELFLRWMELGTFSLQLRSHEGNRPERNWQFDSDAETLSHVARMTEVFDHLKAYRQHSLKEYQETGIPVIRHPYLHYEGDSQLHGLKYQYLFGRDLLVAPVITPRRSAWTVYLPEDQWIHLWSGREFAPGRRRVAAPLGQPPVFYRKRSPFRETFEAIRREFG